MGDIRNIHGIGAKKAMDLRKHYNIRSISILKRYVRKIPNIITDRQRIGLKYHDKIYKQISWDSADKHAKFIKKTIPGATIAGSYRRGDRRIGDIDVLVTTDIQKVVDKLTAKKYIVATLSSGDSKFSGIVNLKNNYRRIDIVQTTKQEKPYALLYFTGDFVQNISMRLKAKKMGYSLSQHGLKKNKTGRFIKPLKTEKDIFNFLKIPYKPPDKRSHSGKEKMRYKVGK